MSTKTPRAGGAGDAFWYENPAILFDKDRAFDILPSAGASFSQQMNSLVRLSLIYSVIVFALRGSLWSLSVPLATMLGTWLASSRAAEGARSTLLEALPAGSCLADREPGAPPARGGGSCGRESECVAPTGDNPFMNVSPVDDRDRPAACDPLDPAVAAEIDSAFERDMYLGTDDVWARKTQSRQFMTMPSTTIPNDQTSFAEALYSGRRRFPYTHDPQDDPPGVLSRGDNTAPR
jgi:hypothetical protein